MAAANGSMGMGKEASPNWGDLKAYSSDVGDLDDGQNDEDGGGDELPPHPLQSDGEGCTWGALETGLQTQVGPSPSVPHSTKLLLSTWKTGHAQEPSQLLGKHSFVLRMHTNSTLHRWQLAFVAGDGSRNVKCGTIWITGKIWWQINVVCAYTWLTVNEIVAL